MLYTASDYYCYQFYFIITRSFQFIFGNIFLILMWWMGHRKLYFINLKFDFGIGNSILFSVIISTANDDENFLVCFILLPSFFLGRC